MLKDILKKGAISFAISSFAGAIINCLIDVIVSASGVKDFCSISPEFLKLFPTTAIAVYSNIMLYGIIGATFAMMTFIFDISRIGFLVQSIIYYVVTAAVCLVITILLWQLQRYPQALIGSLLGYTVTHIIMFTLEYKKLKKDIEIINDKIGVE